MPPDRIHCSSPWVAGRLSMALLLTALFASCTQGESDARASGAQEPRRPADGQPVGPGEGRDPRPEDFARLGEGFVVWESNRTGDWRIWRRQLDGSGLSQLSPDEGDRQHCCPHISPDGTRLTYLSLPPKTRHEFPAEGYQGHLRLITSDGSVVRTLADQARAYGDHRAVVWRDDRELVYIDGEGRTRLLELDGGEGRLLLEEGMPHHGWLVDATLRWATTAGTAMLYAPYDARSRTVAARSPLGGCGGYLTHDGVWGFWVAGAGGPINRLDLATGRSSIILARRDPWMPSDYNYMYFPMISRDGTLFAVGASVDEHDHFRGNYDIFVAELDPRTLEIVSPPLRYTTDPGTDRFPDIWRAPLPLGRQAGKAPFTVALEAGEAGEWEWDFGDGAGSRGPRGEHTYQAPGTYTVRAVREERSLAGQVTVLPASPPEVVSAEVQRAGMEVIVRFSEPVEVAGAEVELVSGREIEATQPGEDGRSLVLRLPRRLESADRVRLSGITDRAQQPNALPATEIAVEAPSWPSRRDGVVFLWGTGNQPNLVFDNTMDADRAVVLEARGRGRLDRNHAMVLGSGAFLASQEAAGYVLDRAKGASTMSFEGVITPGANRDAGPSWIVSFGRGPGARNFALGQSGNRLVLLLTTIMTPRDTDPPQIDLGPIPRGEPSHVAVSYLPGRLAVYVDGDLRLETGEVQGDLNRWRGYPLAFGDDPQGGADWRGSLEGVAFYDRALEAAEVRENFMRYRDRVAARPEVPRLRVEGRLTALSEPPTLRQITPYRQGLMVHEVGVDRVLAGSYQGERLRIARWAIQDGQRLPTTRARVGERVTLTLEPFSAHSQLEPLYLADSLDPVREIPLFYEIEE